MKFLKNMKVSKKLILAFLVVIVFSLMIAAVGIISMGMIHEEDTELYAENTIPMTYLAKLYDELGGQRICANNMVIFYDDDPAFAREERDAIAEKEANFAAELELYRLTIPDAEEQAIYDNIVKYYESDFKDAKVDAVAAFDRGDIVAMTDAIARMDGSASDISDYVDAAFEHNELLALNKVNANSALYKSSTIIISAVAAVALVISMLLGVLISKIISGPVKRVLAVAKQVNETGHLEFSHEITDAVEHDATFKDEIGQMAAAFSGMMDAMIEKGKTLEVVAAGDLTPSVALAGREDTLGNALSAMIDNLNDMFGEINSSAAQVTVGAKQVSDGAQLLAQGSTEQAATVQKLSSSIGEVAEKTARNAAQAEKAAELSGLVRGNAEKGSQQMENMLTAVSEINNASENIGKVIKVIDDIAFQTNILALNAAVEAARAGQYGKGFAVVAEEVRNLAGKSAEAAKDTNVLIENSIEKARFGAQIAEETAVSLRDIVTGIMESTAIVQEIASASEEQAEAIKEINLGIDQVAMVVQQNSATAEESAAASEELNGQADMLSQLVSRFKLATSAEGSFGGSYGGSYGGGYGSDYSAPAAPSRNGADRYDIASSY